MKTVTIELLSEEVLSLLENLENLSLIRLLDKTETKESDFKSLAGSISKESAEKLRQHTTQMRNEWEREF